MIGISVFQNNAFLALISQPAIWIEIILLYVFCTIIRGCVVFLSYGYLQNGPYQFTYREAIILIWGGLRGAVGLALAIVAQKEYVSASKRPESMLLYNDKNFPRDPEDIGNKILLFTSILVLFTLLFNGSSMPWIIVGLRMDAVPTAKVLELRAAFTHVMREGEKKMSILKKNHFYSGADWKLVRDCRFWFAKHKTRSCHSFPLHFNHKDMPNMLKILPRAALNEDVQSVLSPIIIGKVSVIYTVSLDALGNSGFALHERRLHFSHHHGTPQTLAFTL